MRVFAVALVLAFSGLAAAVVAHEPRRMWKFPTRITRWPLTRMGPIGCGWDRRGEPIDARFVGGKC